MTLKLLAFEPVEGKGFYEENDRVFQVRPLYEPDVFLPVSRRQAETVISRENYQAANMEFANINELIDFVRSAYVDNRKEGGLQKPSDQQLKQVFIEADDAMLNLFITKATDEWLPKGEKKRTEKLFRDLNQIPGISSRPALLKATKGLGAKIRAYERISAMAVGVAASRDIEVELRNQFPAFAKIAARKGKNLAGMREHLHERPKCRMVACLD